MQWSQCQQISYSMILGSRVKTNFVCGKFGRKYGNEKQLRDVQSKIDI